MADRTVVCSDSECGSKWIVCQLGAREHYAVPRALKRSGRLAGLFTDAWVRPGNPLGRLKRRLKDRFHVDLTTASVGAANCGLLCFEGMSRVTGKRGWQAILERNAWFQRRAIGWLSGNCESLAAAKGGQPPVLFAYSYAALDLLRWARKQGWKTVLGQIDAGIEDERLMQEVYSRYHPMVPAWNCAPQRYWDLWQQECELADSIIVNSEWSRSLLARAGVDLRKTEVIPLVYMPSAVAEQFPRKMPDEFSVSRPLRVLYLGQVTPRKGAIEVLTAALALKQSPVEFIVVGPQLFEIPSDFLNLRNIRFVGPVPRSHVDDWYRNADVFLFPTHSDGFGLTQLEAQAWGLPIVASRNCGDVVVHGENGLLLPDISAAAITEALLRLCSEPGLLAGLAYGQRNVRMRTLDDFADDLSAVEESLNRDVSVDTDPRITK